MSEPGHNSGDIRFPPHVLREYALLADGERGALIGPRGDIAWMCAPRWDSDAVFSSLIGGAGLYAVTPADPRFVWGGYYEDGSLIWRSRWITTGGIIECRETLAHPGDPDTAILLRQIVADDIPAEVDVVFDPRAGFGDYGMSQLKHQNGYWTGTTGPLHFRWSGGDQAARQDNGPLTTRIRVEPGQQYDLVLELSSRPPAGPPPDASQTWAATESSWDKTLPGLGPNLTARDARLSYAVLAGLTSRGGGMVAAATMSLPERAQDGRNYDYRYAWIRDQCYTGQAIAADGPHPLLDNAVQFVAERVLADGPTLKPAYTVTGENVPDEKVLRQLAGYPGGSAKSGNWVNQQFQLDALGEILLLFAAAAWHEHLDPWHWKAAEAAVKAIEVRWTDPDAGLWELQDEHWTHSRLTCVAGLKAIATVSPPAQAAAWAALADVILADAAKNSVHPSGRWQRAPDDDRVDAALLLPAIRGATHPADSRAVATLDAVGDELVRNGYVYRFRHDERPLHETEGAFGLCGFVMALASEQQGRHADAIGWFERHKAACGPPGLFTEEFDVRQRQLRGNIPQAFVHALMFECSARLGRPERPLSPSRPNSEVC